MAAKSNKTSARKKGGTTKKSSSGKKTGGRNNQKQSQGPDLLTIVVVLIAIVLVIVLISKHSKEKGDDVNLNQPTGSATITSTSVPEEPTKEPDAQGGTPEATNAVTKAPQPTATPTVPPTPTPVPVLSETEARRIAEYIVQLEKYSIELLDDHLMIDGAEYYEFCINDENGEAMLPLLIVEKTEGTLWCYDFSGVVAPIETFPVDNTETGGEGDASMSAEDAKKKIAEYSGAALGLAKEPTAYEMTVDEWTTVADGKECYGVNFFETTDGKQRFRGTFYVALDGSAVYSKDEITGEFIKR